MVSRRPATDRKIAPFEDRAAMYEEVMILASHGSNPDQIIEDIARRSGRRLKKETVSDWKNNRSSPYGRVHRMVTKLIPELAYVIGVRLSDGSRSKSSWHHNYKIRLRVKDYEYAQEFARCVGIVLNRDPYKVSWDKKRKMWDVEANSLILYKFLSGSVAKFKHFIEHCKRCMRAFLRAFFDGEGGVSNGRVSCSNNNVEVLQYIKELLGKFGIGVRGPTPSGPLPGTRVLIKGKLCKVNGRNHHLSLRKQDSALFARRIGFTIKRKQVGFTNRRTASEER